MVQGTERGLLRKGTEGKKGGACGQPGCLGVTNGATETQMEFLNFRDEM